MSVSFEDPDLVESVCLLLHQAQLRTLKLLRSGSARPLREFRTLSTGKPLIYLDIEAEYHAGAELEKLFGGPNQLCVLGEESLDDEAIDTRPSSWHIPKDEYGPRTVALLDMIDGTDLLVRGFSNWCSAAVFYSNGRILAAFVARWGQERGQGIYYATAFREGAYRRTSSLNGHRSVAKVRGPSNTTAIDGATICCYGQKTKNLLSLYENEGFLGLLRDNKNKDLRFYNLAGNPMMVSLIDAPVRVDSVFDIKGQAPHDVVAGAYIAQKAGAEFISLDARTLDESLGRPSAKESRLRYILSATPQLGDQLRRALCPEPPASPEA